MKKKRQGVRAPLAQFVAILVLTISIFLIVDLGRRAAANYRIQREADRLNHEVEAARRYQDSLLAQRTYAASDLYVEEIARKELKWAKPGETVVVVMATSDDNELGKNSNTNNPIVVETTTKTPTQAWWQLFFGNRVPVNTDP